MNRLIAVRSPFPAYSVIFLPHSRRTNAPALSYPDTVANGLLMRRCLCNTCNHSKAREACFLSLSLHPFYKESIRALLPCYRLKVLLTDRHSRHVSLLLLRPFSPREHQPESLSDQFPSEPLTKPSHPCACFRFSFSVCRDFQRSQFNGLAAAPFQDYLGVVDPHCTLLLIKLKCYLSLRRFGHIRNTFPCNSIDSVFNGLFAYAVFVCKSLKRSSIVSMFPSCVFHDLFC